MSNFLIKNFKCKIHRIHFPSNLNNAKVRHYKITFLPRQSHNVALQFMKKYFSDDPLMNALGVSKDDESLNLLDGVWLEDLRYSLSLQALTSEDQKMIGISVNGGQHQGIDSKTLRQLAKNCHSESMSNLFLAWNVLANVTIPEISMGKPNKIFGIAGLAVSADHRGWGIAKQLIRHALCMAKCHDFNVARIDCTSQFTVLAAKSMGFDCIWEKPFSDFRGIRAVIKPHTHARILIKNLDDFMG